MEKTMTDAKRVTELEKRKKQLEKSTSKGYFVFLIAMLALIYIVDELTSNISSSIQPEVITDFFVMRKTLCLLAALALSSLSNAASFSLDLSPTGGGAQNTVSLDGITPQDIFGYETDVWHGTITKSALSGQVSLNDGSLGLQLGGVADVGKGNFAGLKFDMPSGVESAKMSFTITYTSAWGAANFNCDYTCNVYGFTAEGTSTVIGTWSLQNAKASLTQNEPVDVSFDLQLDPDANYSSFGLIFNNTRVANAGGMGCEISNILISGGAVPEPATASLGLLGLGALLLRRRRN